SMVRGTSDDHVRPPPFVGRDRELRLLKDTLTAAIAERRTRHVAIIGEGGIGKTRLAEELKKHIDGYAEDIYWHQGRSPSFGDGVTFWALGEMVRQRAGILEGEEAARSRTRLRTVVTEFVPGEEDREWIEPRLAGLLGLTDMPEGSRSELFAALRAFLQAIAERGPTVLIFEDLHWADAGMVEFIAELVERSTRSPILVVTLARPDILDRHPNWGSQHRSSMAVRLAPMPDADMQQMVGAYLPGLDEGVVAQIAERAAGFPLYAVEIVRMLTGAGELVEVDGVFSYQGDPSVMALPDSLQAVIGARIDRLEAVDQTLLQDASVLGQTFTLAGLSSLRDEPTEELEGRLSALIKLELLDLEDDPRSPERGQYGFVQSLIREVAYHRLPRQERRAKHLAAADHYETMNDPELAGVISGHYMGAFEATPEGDERVALIGQAIRSLTDAADRAVELHSHSQAMALLDDAIEMALDEETRAELRLKAAESATKHGEVERGLAYLDACLEHFAGAGNTNGVRRAATEKSELLNSYFRSPDAVAAIEDVYADLEAVDDPVAVGVAAEAARGFALTQRVEAATAAVDRLLPAAARFGLTRITLDALITKATAVGFAGRTVEAFAILRGVAEESELRGLLHENGRALNNLSSLLFVGDPVQSLEIAERLGEIGRRLGDLGWMVRNAIGIAFSYISDGRYDDALAAIAEFPDEQLDPFNHATVEYQRRVIQHLQGPTSPAVVDDIVEVLAFYSEDTDPQLQAWHQSTVAQLKADLGLWDEAFEIGMQVDVGFDLSGLYIAAQAAAWSRDLDRLKMVAHRLDESPIPAHALNGYIEAATAALEGDVARASELFGALLDEQSRKQLGSFLTQFRATFAMLVGQDDPAAAQAARDADEWLTRTGTATLRSLWAEGLPPDARSELAG
ncbi:MAG: AAA family ATPase, partial [Acidimicrobiia bacterium]|nr:AAA family ATPase [Acidimicrobiia bacterium]